jgi:hypothetical protein
MIADVEALAERLKGEPRIYLSTYWDARSDPLPFERKLEYVRKSFPDAPIRRAEGNGAEPWDSFSQIWRDGFEHLVVVCGSDRRQWFTEVLSRLNGTRKFRFRLISLFSGSRPSANTGEFVISGSRLRALVERGDYAGFAALLAPDLCEADRRAMFDELRTALTTSL